MKRHTALRTPRAAGLRFHTVTSCESASSHCLRFVNPNGTRSSSRCLYPRATACRRRIVPVRGRVEAHGVCALRLPAPVRTEREHHDVTCTNLLIDQPGAPGGSSPRSSVPESSMSQSFRNCMTTRVDEFGSAVSPAMVTGPCWPPNPPPPPPRPPRPPAALPAGNVEIVADASLPARTPVLVLSGSPPTT